MKVGVLTTIVDKNESIGFYNAQYIGLGKALSKYADEVIIYKCLKEINGRDKETIFNNIKIVYIRANSLGKNGIFNLKYLDKSLTALIYFSDTQLMVPQISAWCKKYSIALIPYIGVAESHSTNGLYKTIANILFKRNLIVYRKHLCCVKTVMVQNALREKGVFSTEITPVGLDLDLVQNNFERLDKIDAKKIYGYSENDKILLFIGRLVPEKQPIKMIDIFANLRKQNPNYKLLIVGSGELKSAVENRIQEFCCEKHVKIIDKIPNEEIWKTYILADVFINLNQQEIFGMAILEAMYYGCKVVAWTAPGPNTIIENNINGWLVKSNREVEEKIRDTTDFSKIGHDYVVNNFTWNKTALKMIRIVKKIQKNGRNINEEY